MKTRRRTSKPRLRKPPKLLTPKQIAFVDEYLVDLNAARAVVSAGYSKRGANAAGSRLLANVNIASAIAKKALTRARKLELTADAVLTRAMNVAFGDIRQLVGSDGRIKRITDLGESEQCLIAGFELDEDGRPFKIKVDGRLKALDLLARNLGLLKVDVNLTGALTVFDEETIRAMPDEKLELLAGHLLKVRQLMGVSA